jgi:hypothetical protein
MLRWMSRTAGRPALTGAHHRRRPARCPLSSRLRPRNQRPLGRGKEDVLGCWRRWVRGQQRSADPFSSPLGLALATWDSPRQFGQAVGRNEAYPLAR